MPAPDFSKLRTGMRQGNVQALSIARQRKATAITVVKNPVMTHGITPGQRAGLMETKPAYDFKSIQNAYLVDGFLREAVDKHTDLLLKEGFKYIGEPTVVEYVKFRLRMMSLATGEPWDIIIHNLVRDFIKFGNAFLVIVPSSVIQPLSDTTLNPLQGNTPVGGYFNLPVEQTTPNFDENGALISWTQTLNGKRKVFDAKNVIQLTYCKLAGQIWGTPPTLSSIEDIRAYRQMEESVQRLVDKHLNPLIHQEVPDLVGDGQGRQEDVDDAVMIHQQMAPDGYIITPPGHKIQVLGMESKALKAEAYLDIFKQRVFSDLNVNDEIMGKSSGSHPTADELVAPMIPRVKTFQKVLSIQLTAFVINEILLEGGFDPYRRAEDRVEWVWHEIDIDRKIKEQTHSLNQYTMNVATLDETRGINGYFPLTEEEEVGLYINKVQIPQLVSVHTIERINLGLQAIHPNVPSMGSVSGGGANKVPTPPTNTDDKDLSAITKPTGGTKDIVKDNKAATNLVTPANQHGVKFSPNAPRAHKMSIFRYNVVKWADEFYNGQASIQEFNNLVSTYEISDELATSLKNDIQNNTGINGVLAIQTRLIKQEELSRFDNLLNGV